VSRNQYSIRVNTISPRYNLWIVFLFISLLISACSHRIPQPTPAERKLLEDAIRDLGPDFSKPRLVSGELTLTIDKLSLVSGDSLALNNSRCGIPPGEPPSIHIWSADIVEYQTQKLLEKNLISPEPDTIYIENEYGNRILYWDISKRLSPELSLSISRRFRYITFDYRPIVDAEGERRNWTDIPDDILTKYTRPEPFLEQDDALIDTVFSLLENVPDPVNQAKAIYDWVQKSMTYNYPPDQRGVRNALETLAGDCGQYTALFTSMARIAGIPARQQSGINFYPGNTGYHVWSEIYLPLKGWVPVDATREDGFLHLDNGRLISSIGLNIPLRDIPGWATFANSELEAGRTDFMQMYTLAKSGLSADFKAERIVLRSIELRK